MTVSLFQFSILLRHLPLKIAGIWLIFMNLGSYALLLDLGLSPTLGREISFAAGDPGGTEEARATRIATLIRSCTAIVTMLAFAIALFGAVGGWGYLRTIVPAELASTTRPAWFVYTAGAAINLVGQGWFAGIYGLGHVLHEKLTRSIGAVLGLLFMAVAVYSGTGFMGLAIAYVLQSMCSLSMARIVLSRLTSTLGGKGRFDWSTIRKIVPPSLKYAAMMLGGILILQTDNIVIASILGPAAVPDYQAVARVVSVMMSLSLMLVISSVPLVSQAHARGEISVILQLLGRNLRVTLSVMGVLGSFLACFADRLIAVWLGPHHFVGFPVVWTLLIVMLLEAHHQAMAASTMAAGHIVFLVPALLAGVLNIGISIALAHRLGLIGVVLGTLMAQVVTNNWYVPYYTMRLFRISIAEHARTVILPVMCLIAIMLSTGVLVRLLTAGLSNLFSSSVGCLAIAIAGAISFGVLMINSQEQAALLLKLRTLGSRYINLSSSNPPL